MQRRTYPPTTFTPQRQTRPPQPVRRQRALLILLGALCLTLALITTLLLNALGILAFPWAHTPTATPASTITGTLEDAQTGLPLAHQPFRLRAADFGATSITDDQGRFSLSVPKIEPFALDVAAYEPQQIAPLPHLKITLAPHARETTRRFLNAFQHGEVHQLWSMLHPDAQALWGSEDDYRAFLSHKFATSTVQAFTLEPPNVLPAWTNPITTQDYTNVTIMLASLRLTPASGLLAPPSEKALLAGLFDRLPIAEVKTNGLWRILLAGPLDREAPLLVPAKAPASLGHVPIMMYHHVSPLPTQNAIDFGLTVTADNFQQQMDYLASKGYHPITLTDLFNHLYYQTALPAHPIIITFDDGYEDNYVYAFPILRAHHFVAEINIISGFIGGFYLTWDQIREMNAWGIEIGSHTIHHIGLASVSSAVAAQELLDSKTTLEAQLGHPVQFFCYPSGDPFHRGTPDRQQLITGLLAQDGYVGALLDPPPTSSTQDATHPYELNRIRVSGGEAMSLFISILSSVQSSPT